MRQGRSLPGFETPEGKTYGLCRGKSPPAALALCRLLGEAWGDEAWRRALGEVAGETAQEAVASRGSETS